MSWQKSINNVIVFNFLNNMSFERVLWVIYLLDKNMSLIEIGLIQSILNISMFIFEFPSGFIGDRYGRRISLFIGNFMIMTYLFVFLFSDNFYQFCMGSIFYGLGLTFISGSNEALVYDNLKSLNKESKYNNILSKISFISILGLLISIYVGGVLEKISLNLIFIIGIIVRIIASLFILFIKEHPYLSTTQKPTFINIKASIYFFKTNRLLLYFLFTSSLFISFFSVYVLFGQEILRINGEENLYDISLIFVLLYSLSGIISLVYNKLIKSLTSTYLIFCNSLLIGMLLLLSIYKNIFNYYSIIFIIVGALYEINDLTYNIIINNLSASNLRARIFSMYSLLTTIFMSFFSIIITYVLSNKLINFNKQFFILSLFILFASTYGAIITIKKTKGVTYGKA